MPSSSGRPERWRDGAGVREPSRRAAMTMNPMTPIQDLRQALIDQIGRSFFGFAPNGRPEQRILYAELRSYLIALVRDGYADDVLLQRPGLTACAFFERLRIAKPD